MALVAEPTRIVTVEGQARPVENLPQTARDLLVFFDEIKTRELNARADLLEAQAAMRSLQAEIAAVIQQADDEKAAAEAEETKVGEEELNLDA